MIDKAERFFKRYEHKDADLDPPPGTQDTEFLDLKKLDKLAKQTVELEQCDSDEEEQEPSLQYNSLKNVCTARFQAIKDIQNNRLNRSGRQGLGASFAGIKRQNLYQEMTTTEKL